MRAVFTGHETLTFMDYLDLETGRTLTAEPGRVYDVAPAGGRPVPVLPPGFVQVQAPKPKVITAAAGMQGSGKAATAQQPDEQ